MSSTPRQGRRRRPHKAAAVTVLLGFALAGISAGEARHLTNDNERRILGQEATIEASAVSSLVVTVKGSVDSTVVAADATGGDLNAFKQVAPGYFGTWVLQRRTPAGWMTALVIGKPTADLTGPSLRSRLDGVADGNFAVIGFFGQGASRVLGVAETRQNYRVYGEIGLPVSAALDPKTGAVAGSLPNLAYALYTDRTEQTGTLALTNSPHLPLSGRRAVVDVDLNTQGGAGQARLGSHPGGASIKPGDLLLVTSPSGPLTGGFAAKYPWILLGAVLIATFAMGIAVEVILRRRDEALVTIARLEAHNEALDRAMDERTQMENQLRAAHRLEAVGKLAGGIADDFNNLLAVILNYATFAVEQLQDHPAKEDIDEVVGAARRAADLTRQLLVFSRQDIVEPRIIDLNVVVAGMERLLQRTLGEDLTLQTSLDPELASVTADEGELEQVLMNLAVNARDAMSASGGALTISTDNVFLEPDEARHHPGLEPGPYVRMRVRDTGEGIPDEVLARAFEPFFTTKAPGEGTGLGLATVYGIVTRWGGEVSAVSEIGTGSEFTVLLPGTADPADVDAPTVAAPPAVAVARRVTVLIVEDERAVRGAARRILERAGYDVLESESGADALRRDDLEHVDVLLTDVVMPGGVSGRELAAQVAQRRPEIRVLFMSGYTADVIANRGVLDPGITLIDKPFTAATLLTAVAGAVADPGRAETSGASV